MIQANMDDSNHYPLIIIGAGPAGLMAAISAENAPTLLIEKGPNPGRKLLITAAGQCNLTHRGSTVEILSHYNKKEKFLRPALFDYTSNDLIEFFENRGIPTFFDEKGRCLPRSLSARDILNQLIQTVREKNIRFHQNDGVQSIVREEKLFRIVTKENSFSCSRLIISTGGMSFPNTGSNGEGYKLARSLGHSIVTPRPALTGIEAEAFTMAALAGLSFDERSIEIFREDKKTGQYTGNLLITHMGLSGPVIIDNSRDMRPKDVIKINFMGKNREEMAEQIRLKTVEEGKKSLKNYLKSLDFPRKFIPYLIPADGESPLSQLKKKERNQLITNLTAYPFTIARIQGFNTAMVTAGGIETKEINPKTMESRLVPGLYFAGEVLDVDGISGGYNLQAAFSTGHLAGKSART